MQVFVSGTWRDEKAAPYREQAVLLGSRLAASGIDLACGPGTGISRHVIDAYRTQSARGRVRFYLPKRELMADVGEVMQPGADDVQETGLDYPMRNVFQIQQSDGLFILTGGDGTLEEALPALIDYGIPVAVVDGSGSAAIALRQLVAIYPEWSSRLFFGKEVATLASPFIQQVQASFKGRQAATRDEMHVEEPLRLAIADSPGLPHL